MRRWIAILWMCAAAEAQAATWYVRPLTTFENAVENGQSYATAWDGVGAIVWGESGVKAGDTLYVCGEHRYATSGGDFSSAGAIAVGAAGTDGNYITIRGDYPGDLGSIINATRVLPTPGTWAELYPGVFVVSSTTAMPALLFQLEPAPVMLLASTTTATVVSTDASIRYTGSQIWYNPAGDGWTSATIPRYFHTPINQAVDIQGNSYVKVIGLKAYGAGSNRGHIVINRDDSPTSFVTVQNCELRFGLYTGIYTNRPTSDVVIDGNTISDIDTGTYTIGNGGSSTVYYYRRWVFSNNLVEKNSYASEVIGAAADRHALGGQDMADTIWEGNVISGWPGDGIGNYANSYSYCTTLTVRNNLILNLTDRNDAFHHYGIFMTGSNAVGWEQRMAGLRIYNNIIAGCGPGAAGAAAGDGAGIRIKGRGTVDGGPFIYNNVFYNNVSNINFFTMTGWAGQGGTLRNNIFLSPRTGGYHIFVPSVTGDDPLTIDSDYNLFWPDTSGSDNIFRWDGTNAADFAGWKTASLQDAHSVLADPTLAGAGTYDEDDDFIPLAGSPAFGAGTNVGLTTDYFGNTLTAFNIGAYGLADVEPEPDPTPTPSPGSGGGGTKPELFRFFWREYQMRDVTGNVQLISLKEAE